MPTATPTKPLTDTDRARICLEGQRDFYNRVAELAELALPMVPNHKQLTKRINDIFETGLAGKVATKTGYGPHGTPYQYDAERVYLRKASYSDYQEIVILTEKTDIGNYRSDEPRKNSETFSYRVDSVEDLRAKLSQTITVARQNAQEAAQQLPALETVQRDYDELKALTNAFTTKYGYTVRNFFDVKRMY